MNKLNKTNNVRIIFLVIIAILIATGVNALSTNGTNRNNDFAVTSGKNAELSDSNFITYLVVGDVAGTIESSNFKTELGFIRTAHYLDGEACEIALECVGGFCCSSVCRSSSCPVEEEPTPSAVAAAVGGGGAVPVGRRFSIDVDLIRVLIKQGETYRTKFTIENTGSVDLSFEIDYSALSDLMLLSEARFNLAAGEAKVIDVTIFAGEEQKPDIYSGNIKITADNIRKSLPVIIEVQAKKPLFDINVKIPPKYKNVLKTETVIANITLINVGDLKPVDVELYYSIRDIEGKDLTFGIETLAVYDKVFRLKELELPSNISFGTYMFYAKVTYGAEEAAAVDVFYVVEIKPATCFDAIQNQLETGVDCGGPCEPCKKGFVDFFKSILWFIILGLIIIILLIIVFIISRKRSKRPYKKQYREIQKIYDFIDSALNKGYKSEHIKTHLLSKGLPKKAIDDVHNKVISDKLRKLRRTATQQKPKRVVKAKPIRLPRKLKRDVVNYINKALDLGHTTNQIEELFLKVGWPLAEIRKHISEVERSRRRKNKK